jgi:hypothetical protein
MQRKQFRHEEFPLLSDNPPTYFMKKKFKTFGQKKARHIARQKDSKKKTFRISSAKWGTKDCSKRRYVLFDDKRQVYIQRYEKFSGIVEVLKLKNITFGLVKKQSLAQVLEHSEAERRLFWIKHTGAWRLIRVK